MMGAEDIEQAGAPPHVAFKPPAAAAATDQRSFRVGLASAAILHALLIIGIVGAGVEDPTRRRLGATGGLEDGVAIELVDAADLKSKSSVGDNAPPPTPQAQPNEKAAQPQRETPAMEAQKQTPEPQQPAQKPVEQKQKQEATALAKQTPDLLTVPDLTGKPPERPTEKREQRPQQQQPQPQQQQQPPPSKSTRPEQMVPSGTFASLSRPAGITRSGENDDFARGVIRALRQTMPTGRGNRGRVTIRFLLSEIGNMVEVQVVHTTAGPPLTQDVAFSSKQSSFPIPPRGATVVDRTFLVTYIYE